MEPWEVRSGVWHKLPSDPQAVLCMAEAADSAVDATATGERMNLDSGERVVIAVQGGGSGIRIPIRIPIRIQRDDSYFLVLVFHGR